MATSKKKQNELWQAINEEIMNARIKIAPLIKGLKNEDEIDRVLFHLSINAPNRVIDVLNPINKPKN